MSPSKNENQAPVPSTPRPRDRERDRNLQSQPPQTTPFPPSTPSLRLRNASGQMIDYPVTTPSSRMLATRAVAPTQTPSTTRTTHPPPLRSILRNSLAPVRPATPSGTLFGASARRGNIVTPGGAARAAQPLPGPAPPSTPLATTRRVLFDTPARRGARFLANTVQEEEEDGEADDRVPPQSRFGSARRGNIVTPGGASRTAQAPFGAPPATPSSAATRGASLFQTPARRGAQFLADMVEEDEEEGEEGDDVRLPTRFDETTPGPIARSKGRGGDLGLGAAVRRPGVGGVGLGSPSLERYGSMTRCGVRPCVSDAGDDGGDGAGRSGGGGDVVRGGVGSRGGEVALGSMTQRGGVKMDRKGKKKD